MATGRPLRYSGSDEKCGCVQSKSEVQVQRFDTTPGGTWSGAITMKSDRVIE
jgi:hypothetical protein